MRKLRTTYYAFFLLTISGVMVLCSNVLNAQGFECNGQMYISHIANNLEARIDVITPDTMQPFFDLIPPVDAALSVIGYSVRDKHIYGFDRNNYRVYKVNANGETTDLGVPEDLDLEKIYYAGGIHPSGRSLYLIGQDPNTGVTEVLYSINILNTPLNAGQISILSDFPRQIGDIAWDPTTGVVYGFDAIGKIMVIVNLFNGLITDFRFQPVSSLPSIGALFFDREGNLYGYSESGNKMYWFNKSNGTVIKSFSGPGGIKADGCGCPYQMRIRKVVSPQQVIPCGEVTIIYDLHNTAGRSYSQLWFRDSFPPEFTITEIVQPPSYGTIESGVGTNKFEVSQMDIVLGRDSVIIKVDVGDYSHPYLKLKVSSAGNFPDAFGTIIHSDDPTTEHADDPTRIEILEADSIFKKEEMFFCPETPVTLRAPQNALAYLWNDSSTGQTLITSSPGMYWVEVTGTCVVYRDTVRLLEQITPLSIDLGEDKAVSIGAPTALHFTSNVSGDLDVQWEASLPGVLNCVDCSTPILTTLEPLTIGLWAFDPETGCSATDEMEVTVVKERRFYLPTAFSPNDDGINDVFYPQGEGVVVVRRFEVYDRWGGVVFSQGEGLLNDATFSWDGRYRGQKAPPGLYLWRIEIEFPDGEVYFDQGQVSLVR